MLWPSLSVAVFAVLAPAALASAPRGAAALSDAPLSSGVASLAPSIERALKLDDTSPFTLDGATLASSEREERLTVFAGDELKPEPLRTVQQRRPKTRVGVFPFLGSTLIGVERGVSLELHWGCGDFRCRLAEGLFQGSWTDPVTGLQYKRARWYDPQTGVFLSEDPAGNVDSPSLYAYVGNRPHEFRDPLGLARRTANGGVNYLGDLGDVVEVQGPFTQALSIGLDYVGNNVSDLLSLDLIADKSTIVGDTNRTATERTRAGAIGTTVAALNVAGGEILGGGAKLLLKIPGAKSLASKVASSGVAKFLTRDVRSFLPRPGAVGAGASPRPGSDFRLADINPGGPAAPGRSQNCAQCSVAMDATAAGRPATAMPASGPTKVAMMENAIGAKFEPSSQGAILYELGSAAQGSRGVVLVSYGPGRRAHVFNAVNQNGVVKFIDAQSATEGLDLFNGVRAVFFARTN